MGFSKNAGRYKVIYSKPVLSSISSQMECAKHSMYNKIINGTVKFLSTFNSNQKKISVYATRFTYRTFYQ